MKITQSLKILLVLLLMCSCNREESTLSDYRKFAMELKENSSDYTEEDWNDVVKKYEELEKEVEQCKFSSEEKKELNRLRGRCAVYLLKSITKQAKHKMEDTVEQFSDMVEGVNEAFSEEGLDDFLDNKEE